MSRVIKGWLDFNGRRSTEFGVRLMEGVVYSRPAWRGKSQSVTGRSGDLWRTESNTRLIYDTVEIKRKLRCSLSRLDEVAAWLTGSGMLIFSWAPDRAYQARAAKVANFDQVSVENDPLIEFTIAFECQPLRFMLPEAKPIVITESGTTILNPGTAPSDPIVKITGSGEFTVTIGMETLFFTDVSGGIIVDSDKMDAFTIDGTLLANGCMSGTPWQIMPGDNVVSWQVEDGSSIESVEITPRWRCI